MNIIYRDFVTTQISNSQYQKSILSLLLSFAICFFLVLIFILLRKENNKKNFLFLVLALLLLLFSIHETKNLKEIKYRKKHYETYNQYYVTKSSKIDLKKFVIKSQNDDYVVIEDRNHHHVVEP